VLIRSPKIIRAEREFQETKRLARREFITGAAAVAAYAKLAGRAEAASDFCGTPSPTFNGQFNPVWPGCSVFVLDLLSAFPAVAYSVRKLTKNYFGPCMNVRRSTDGATKDIYFVNGLLDVVTLLAFCGSGNGFVTKWYNQGYLSSSADATQSTAANQPQVVASGVVNTQNGVPSVAFSTTSWLNLSGPYVNAFTSNGVWSKNADNLQGILWGGPSAIQFLRVDSSLHPHVFISYDYNSSSIWSLTNLSITTFVRNGTNVSVYLNGTAGSPITPPATSGLQVLALGSTLNGVGADSKMASEAMLWTVILNSADQSNVEISQGKTFGISGVTQ
jgi:hypothetical protein